MFFNCFTLVIKDFILHCIFEDPGRAVTRALILLGGGGGCTYSYIRVLLDEFLLKSIVITVDIKKVHRAEREYMNMHLKIKWFKTK